MGLIGLLEEDFKLAHKANPNSTLYTTDTPKTQRLRKAKSKEMGKDIVSKLKTIRKQGFDPDSEV